MAVCFLVAFILIVIIPKVLHVVSSSYFTCCVYTRCYCWLSSRCFVSSPFLVFVGHCTRCFSRLFFSSFFHSRVFFHCSSSFSFHSFKLRFSGTLFPTSEGKKIVPNKKGDIGMEVHYLCQPNTYDIAREFGEQQ